MLGFWLINMIIPGDPEKAIITTSSGQWFLQRSVDFVKCKNLISKNQCGHTYSIEIAISMGRSCSV